MICYLQFNWKHRVLRDGAILVAILFLVGCASLTLPSPTAPPKGGGGEFRVALAVEPLGLNPDLRTDDAAFVVSQSIYNKLVTLDADYRVIPDLAETWEASDDGLTYRFNLAKNVKWHDGKPFTSADVKWTFEALAQGGRAQDTAGRVAKIETPDAATVVVRLKETWSPFIPTLGWYGTFILPQHLFEGSDWERNPVNDKPVGTGPFKFIEWVKGDHITLEANRDFFRRGPFLDKVIYRFPKDSAAAAEQLLKGEMDYSYARPAVERIPELQQAPGLQVKTFPHPARYYVGFNLRRKPFDDLRVRQAINMAINRSALVDRAMLGYGAPGLGFYTPAIPWVYNPQAHVPAFDAAGAEKLLDEAGVKRGADGTRLKLTLVTFTVSPFKEIAQALPEQLRSVGIEANVVVLTTTDWNKCVFQDYDFDLALADGSHGPDPEQLNFRFGSKGGYQFMGYSSAEFDAATAAGARQMKLQDRAKAYFRAQEILARDLPIAPLAENVQFIVYRDGVTGLPQVEGRGLVTFQDFSLVRVKK